MFDKKKYQEYIYELTTNYLYFLCTIIQKSYSFINKNYIDKFPICFDKMISSDFKYMCDSIKIEDFLYLPYKEYNSHYFEKSFISYVSSLTSNQKSFDSLGLFLNQELDSLFSIYFNLKVKMNIDDIILKFKNYIQSIQNYRLNGVEPIILSNKNISIVPNSVTQTMFLKGESINYSFYDEMMTVYTKFMKQRNEINNQLINVNNVFANQLNKSIYSLFKKDSSKNNQAYGLAVFFAFEEYLLSYIQLVNLAALNNEIKKINKIKTTIDLNKIVYSYQKRYLNQKDIKEMLK